jgi:3-dehydroquinate synthase
VVVVTDEVVARIWLGAARASLEGAGIQVFAVVIPSGEANKTLATFSACLDAVLGHSIDRRTPILALGGGVVGDIAGFVAATALRGLPFVQVPTTLLAMVDSSVGGKTGINHTSGKNRIGAFHQPSLVFAPLSSLSTLPPRERSAGLAEVIKTAVLGDADLLRDLERGGERMLGSDPTALAPIIARAVEIKARVVAEDEREAGARAILNFGHTVGHALEHALGYGTLLHGEAVALGMVAETRWAIATGICRERTLADRIATLCARLGLPPSTPPVDRSLVVQALALDKKAMNRHLRVPMPLQSGKMVLIEHPFERLVELLEELP